MSWFDRFSCLPRRAKAVPKKYCIPRKRVLCFLPSSVPASLCDLYYEVPNACSHFGEAVILACSASARKQPEMCVCLPVITSQALPSMYPSLCFFSRLRTSSRDCLMPSSTCAFAGLDQLQSTPVPVSYTKYVTKHMSKIEMGEQSTDILQS